MDEESMPWTKKPAVSRIDPTATPTQIDDILDLWVEIGTKPAGETLEDYCHRMNTSDEPEAVEFRRRWAQTESGRGDNR